MTRFVPVGGEKPHLRMSHGTWRCITTHYVSIGNSPLTAYLNWARAQIQGEALEALARQPLRLVHGPYDPVYNPGIPINSRHAPEQGA